MFGREQRVKARRGHYTPYSLHTLKANSHRHARHDTDRTVSSCLVWRCELSRLDRPTSPFCIRVYRAAQCDRRTHSDAERTCPVVSSHRHTRHDETVLSVSCLAWRCELALSVCKLYGVYMPAPSFHTLLAPEHLD